MDKLLGDIPIFRNIPSVELKEIAKASQLRRFKKGEMVFEENQPAQSVWIVKRGWVYLIKRTPHGGLSTIFIMTPDEAICGVSAFDYSTYSASAVSATDTQLIEIPVECFSKLLGLYPRFSKEVLLSCCTRMRHMAEAISLSHSPVEQRLAYTLLRLRSTFGKTVPITHQELARMMGTRLETSIRAVSVFKRRGWLSTVRGKMTIISPGQLKGLLGSSGRDTDFLQADVRAG